MEFLFGKLLKSLLFGTGMIFLSISLAEVTLFDTILEATGAVANSIFSIACFIGAAVAHWLEK